MWSRAYLHSDGMNGVTTGIGGVKRRFARSYTGKDSLLDVGQLTTRDWTSADSSWLCFVVSIYMIYLYTLDRVSPWSIARPCACFRRLRD